MPLSLGLELFGVPLLNFASCIEGIVLDGDCVFVSLSSTKGVAVFVRTMWLHQLHL